METKKVKIALFQQPGEDIELVFPTRRNDGTEPYFSGYVRITEWVEVDLPMREGDELAAMKQKETDAIRTRLQAQLAALDVGGSK